MRKFHTKSIVLGIGIGIILTSIISLIYTAGLGDKGLSEKEIKDLARKYGMVEKGEVRVNKKDKEDTINIASNEEKDKIDVQNGDNSNSTKEVETKEFITIIIEQGDSSDIVTDRLFESGVISDKESFKAKLENMRLSDKIQIGKFKIEKGSDVQEIINMITGG